MNIKNITPEAEKAVSQLLDADDLNLTIVQLENAEQAMQKVAYEDRTGNHDYLYCHAYELQLIRKELEKLEQLLGYHPDRD